MKLYKRILVIRLSAFGDIILSFPVFAALRRHYPDAEITLLTLRAFGTLVEGCPYVDHVWTIAPWSWKQPAAWLAFARELRARRFDCVYDIQRNDRTRILSLLAPASLRKKWYDRKGGGFAYDAGALVATDIGVFPPVGLEWMRSDIGRFGIREPFVLLVPGSAPQHPQKRWPAGQYAALARRMAEQGYTPVLVGAQAEADVLGEIARAAPAAVNLCGQTSMWDISALARGAAAAVGNDTGPMHLISIAGCPVVSLFSGASRPAQSAPRGRIVKVLQAQDIADVPFGEVFLAFRAVLQPSAPLSCPSSED
jgi:ADP-heptose:LPS heptosyltransferase